MRRLTILFAILIAATCTSPLAIAQADNDTWTVTWTSVARRTKGSLVQGTLPAETTSDDAEDTAVKSTGLRLKLLPDGPELIGQRSIASPHAFFFRLPTDVEPNQTLTLRVARDDTIPAPITASLINGRIELRSGDQPMLAYHVAVLEPPQDLPDYYRRSGFIHPLQTPAGKTVTDDFPPDHPHQHGIFRAWVNTTFRDEKIDFWNQHARTGTVRHSGEPRMASGPLFAEFIVNLEHVTLTEKQPEVVVLKETWGVRGWPQDDTFQFELISNQRAATEDPLVLHEYHYGGLAVRGNRQWTAESSFDFKTDLGHGRATGNHTPARWVIMQGPLQDTTAFSVSMASPRNFRAPQPVRLHPSMPYFAFAPVAAGGFEISAEHPLDARFRIITGDGTAEPDTVESWWRDFAASVEQQSANEATTR